MIRLVNGKMYNRVTMSHSKWYQHLVGCYRGLDPIIVDAYFAWRDGRQFYEHYTDFGYASLFDDYEEGTGNLYDFNSKLVDKSVSLSVGMLYQRFYDHCHPTALEPVMHQSCDIQYNDIFKYYPYIIDGEYSAIHDGFYGVDERHRYHWFSSKDWEEAWPNKSCVHCIQDCGMMCLQDDTNTVDLREVESAPNLLFSMVGRVAITGRYDCELAQSIRPAVDLLCKRMFASRYQVRYYENLDEDDEGIIEALNGYSNKFSEELCELGIESEPVEGESDNPVLTAIFSIYRDNDTQEVVYSLTTEMEKSGSGSLLSISDLPDSKKELLEDYLSYIDSEEPIKIQNGNVDLQNVTEEVKSMILDYLEQLRAY